MAVKFQKVEIEPAVDEKLLEAIDTYVPPIDELCRRAGIDRASLEARTVTIPTSLFKFLLTAFLERMHVDEEAYCKENPDVAEAVKAGKVYSGRYHFVTNGYFEGRRPGDQPIDEEWYMSAYPDIALAFRKGQITDLRRHYNDAGRYEGRAASAKQRVLREAWDRALD